MSRRTPGSRPRTTARKAPRIQPVKGPARARSSRSTKPGPRRSMDELLTGGRTPPRRSPEPRSSSQRGTGSRSNGREASGRMTNPRQQSGERARRDVEMRQPATKPSRRHRADVAPTAKRRQSGQSRRAAHKPTIGRQVLTRRSRRVVGRFRVGQTKLRLIAMLVVLLLILSAVLFKVATLQTAGGESLRAEGDRQWSRTTTLLADRGTLFDRNGEELAVSVPAVSISVNPKLITDDVATVQLLQSVLGLDNEETAELLAAVTAKQTGFRYVRRQIDPGIGDQLRSLELPGVNVDAEDRRILPGGDTGRSVIGLTDIDGKGIAGLELQYDQLLTGTDGEMSREVAPQGRSIAGTEQVSMVPVPGNDVVLTIDRSIQFATEEALLKKVTEIEARSGTVVVMDTDTGDVYAMASVRRNDEGVVEISSANYAAVAAYEPGSVAKVITMAAALNEGAVTPESTFVVPWRRQYADDMLKDSHEHPDELMTVRQILVESSNIGTIDVQQTIGRERHWEYMRQFGLGEPTALDFPGESSGILKHWTDLWGSERVTVAYGQGVSSTSIQLAAAVNTIANDGTYVAPRLVQATVGPDGSMTDAAPSATHEVVSPTVAAQVQSMMRGVVCKGTASRAQIGIENFSVAGKTGTGYKAQPNGTYQNEAGEYVYYASFVGFFPAESPEVTVLVSIDEPPAGTIDRFGGTAAAPVFADLAPTIVHELGIVPPADTTPCGDS